MPLHRRTGVWVDRNGEPVNRVFARTIDFSCVTLTPDPDVPSTVHVALDPLMTEAGELVYLGDGELVGI